MTEPSSTGALIEQLPSRLRFLPNAADQAALAQALGNGWSVAQIADRIIDQVGPTATSPSALAVATLRSCAGTKPPPERKTASGVRGTGMPMPECRECGQPHGARGGLRPPLGDRGRECRSCGQPLFLVQYDPDQYRIMP